MSRSGVDVPGSVMGGYAAGKAPEWADRDKWIAELQADKAAARRRAYLDSVPQLRRQAGACLTVYKR